MSKLFGLHYSLKNSNGCGYAIAYCKSENDAVRASGLASNAEVHEIVELDKRNYTTDQWNGMLEREMKKQGIL